MWTEDPTLVLVNSQIQVVHWLYVQAFPSLGRTAALRVATVLQPVDV
jgi:hypothetical protein